MVERENITGYDKKSQNFTAPHSHPTQTFKLRVKNEKQMFEFHPRTSDHSGIWW